MSRPTRLRWLAGRRDDGHAWDVYEACPAGRCRERARRHGAGTRCTAGCSTWRRSWPRRVRRSPAAAAGSRLDPRFGPRQAARRSDDATALDTDAPSARRVALLRDVAGLARRRATAPWPVAADGSSTRSDRTTAGRGDVRADFAGARRTRRGVADLARLVARPHNSSCRSCSPAVPCCSAGDADQSGATGESQDHGVPARRRARARPTVARAHPRRGSRGDGAGAGVRYRWPGPGDPSARRSEGQRAGPACRPSSSDIRPTSASGRRRAAGGEGLASRSGRCRSALPAVAAMLLYDAWSRSRCWRWPRPSWRAVPCFASSASRSSPPAVRPRGCASRRARRSRGPRCSARRWCSRRPAIGTSTSRPHIPVAYAASWCSSPARHRDRRSPSAASRIGLAGTWIVPR